MLTQQIHTSPHTTLWKKLRLIKKCAYCRNTSMRSKISSENLTKYQRQAQLVSQLLQKTIININIANGPFFKIKQFDQQINTAQSSTNIRQQYYTQKTNQRELINLIHYYRFLQINPIIIVPQFYKLIQQYRIRRKMYEYCRIQTLYSPQKSTKETIKKREKVHRKQDLLSQIICQINNENNKGSRLSISRLTQIKTTKYWKLINKKQKRMNLQYNVKSKSNKKYSSKKQTVLTEYPQKLRSNPHKKVGQKTKKHHKSCDNIVGEYKNSPTKININKQEDKLAKFRLCIIKMKDEIRNEKQLLAKKQDTFRVKKNKLKTSQKKKKKKNI